MVHSNGLLSVLEPTQILSDIRIDPWWKGIHNLNIFDVKGVRSMCETFLLNEYQPSGYNAHFLRAQYCPVWMRA